MIQSTRKMPDSSLKASNTITEDDDVITTDINDSAKDGKTVNALPKTSTESTDNNHILPDVDDASKKVKEADGVRPKSLAVSGDVDSLKGTTESADNLMNADISNATNETVIAEASPIDSFADDDILLDDDITETSNVLNTADAISTATTLSAEDEDAILADVNDVSKPVSPKTVEATSDTIQNILKGSHNGGSANEKVDSQNASHDATSKSKDSVDMDVDTIQSIGETESSSKLAGNLNILLSDDEDDQSKDIVAKYPETSTQTQNGDDEVLLLNDDNAIENGDIARTDKQNGQTSSSISVVAEKKHNDGVTENPVSTNMNVDKSKNKQINDEPLIPLAYIRSFRDKIAHMTRDDMEEFVLQKIIEGIAERSELSEMKSNMKTLQNAAEEWRKKALLLTKQCRDLQVVLKNVQEEQAKRKNEIVIPLKITRSVGLQVLMAGAGTRPRPVNLSTAQANRTNVTNNLSASPQPSFNNCRRQNTPRSGPVPVQSRPGPKSAIQRQKPAQTNQQTPKKIATPTNMTIKHSPAEKRPIQSIDLTDEEPPAKTQVMSSPSRAVTPGSNSAPRAIAPYPNGNNNFNKAVFAQPSPSPAGSVVFKSNQFNVSAPPPLVKQKLPSPVGVSKAGQAPMVLNQIRMPMRPNLISYGSSAPPLPFTEKQRSNPLWKKLPPKLELTISKSQAGIVISWKLDTILNDTFEDIASYQIYAYQEVSDQQKCWKKIGDVKALPLPMACTLTKFTTGYRYFFAVRGVDVKSRLGPFSEPGSILLISHSNGKKSI